MIAFIKEHREVCGVAPICRVLQIAPSTFYAHLTVENDPDKASDRAKRDDELHPELMRDIGIEGVRLGKKIKTTWPDGALPCPMDRVNK